jgi:asparagine synthase (glutamine-hydrolysing)
VYPKADWLPRPLRFKRTLQNLARDPASAYFRSVSCALPDEALALIDPDLGVLGHDPFTALRAAYQRSDATDPLSKVLYTDIHTNLTDDILTKVDRAAMAVSLEVRAPLLDHRFVELCARIPAAEKIWRGQGKALFKAALRGRVPPTLLDRTKQGFTVPLRRWARTELSEVLDQMADGQAVASYLQPAAVANLLAAHRSGRRDHGELLWSLLCFDQWHRHWLEAPQR